MFIEQFEIYIKNNKKEELVSLINETLYINEPHSDSGTNALMMALVHENLPIFKLLLQKGIHTRHQDHVGENILSYICWKGCLDFAETLFHYDPHFPLNEAHSNPLFLSIMQKNKELISFLIEKGCNVNQTFLNGENPLSFAISQCCEDIVLLLLEKGADLHALNTLNESALLKAILHEQFGLAEVFLKKGVDPNVADYNGTTPLIACCIHGQLSLLSLLLEYGAKINQSDLFGRTPLYWASFNGRDAFVSFLLFKDADPNIEDIANFSPFEMVLHDNEIQNKSEVMACYIRYFYRFNEKNMELLSKNRLRLLFI